MFNPLAPDPKELTDQELTDKISKVLERMSFASQMGHPGMWQQLNGIYGELVLEQQRRMQTTVTEDEHGFDDLIDVRKK